MAQATHGAGNTWCRQHMAQQMVQAMGSVTDGIGELHVTDSLTWPSAKYEVAVHLYLQV